MNENPASDGREEVAETNWQYKPEGASPGNAGEAQAAGQDAAPQEIVWTASSFIAYHKGAGWYAALIAVTLAIDLVLYLWIKDFVAIAAVTIMATLIGIMASRQPRSIEYALDESGIAVGNRSFSYEEFKTFSIIEEGAFVNIILQPLKRFGLPLSMYCDPDQEEKILDVLSQHIPLEDKPEDTVSRWTRQIRF